MIRPGFGNRFPGTQPGWLSSVSQGQGNPTSVNQAPSTLNMVQSTRAHDWEQISAGVTFGQQYSNRLPPAITTYTGQSQAVSSQTAIWNERRQQAPQAQGLNAHAPGFKPQENNEDYYERRQVQLVGGTLNSRKPAHRETGIVHNTERVKIDGQQNSRDNIRAVTETQHWNIRADSNQIPNTISSGSRSTYHDIGQEEPNMTYNQGRTNSCHPLYTNIGQRGGGIDSSGSSQAATTTQAVKPPPAARGSNITRGKMPDRYTWRSA